MAYQNNPFSCDDVVLDAADLGHEYGGPVGGVAAAGVTVAAMATPAGAPATASQLATGGLALYGAYQAGHDLGEHYAAPLAADLAYVGCLPAEIGSDVGHAIGSELHNLFYEPPPQNHLWSPDLASGAPGDAAHNAFEAAASGGGQSHNAFDGPAWSGHVPAVFEGAAAHNAFDAPSWGGGHGHNAFDGPAWGGHAGDAFAHASSHDSGASGHDGGGSHSDHGGGGHSMGDI